MQRPTVAMDQQKQDNIRQLLNNLNQVDNVPPQMLHDFDDSDVKNEGGWWNEQPAASGGRSSSAAATVTSTDVVDNWEDLTDDTDFTSGESSQRQPSGRGSGQSPDRQKFARQSTTGHEFSSRAAGSSSKTFTEGQTFANRSRGGRTFSDMPLSSSCPRSSTSQGLPHTSSSGAFESADDDVELEEDVPQVSGLLEYDRAHADIIYLDEEMGEGVFCNIWASWPCSIF